MGKYVDVNRRLFVGDGLSEAEVGAPSRLRQHHCFGAEKCGRLALDGALGCVVPKVSCGHEHDIVARCQNIGLHLGQNIGLRLGDDRVIGEREVVVTPQLDRVRTGRGSLERMVLLDSFELAVETAGQRR